METKERATAIDETNIGKLVQYHLNGWRFGTLAAVTPENVRIKKITGGHDVTVALDDVRLVIEEPEKPKPTVLDKSPSGPNATVKAKLFDGGIVAIDKAKKKSGKPEKITKPKAAKKAARKPAKKSKTTPPENVKFDIARIVKLYDRGKGKSVSDIAQACGYEKGKGNNRVANALIKEGVFKGTRTQQ